MNTISKTPERECICCGQLLGDTHFHHCEHYAANMSNTFNAVYDRQCKDRVRDVINGNYDDEYDDEMPAHCRGNYNLESSWYYDQDKKRRLS